MKITRPKLWLRPDTGTWYILYSRSGKQQKVAVGKNKRLAEVALSEMIVKHDRIAAGLEILDKDSLSYNEFKIKIEQYIKTRKRASTKRKYLFHLELFENYLNGKVKTVQDITKATINDYITFRIQQGKAPKTINDEVDTLRALFNVAIELELIDDYNPFRNLKAIRPQKVSKTPFFYKREEIDNIFQFLSERYKPYFYTLLGTGVRAGELLLLEWDNYDLNNYMLTVLTHADRSESKMRTRSIPLSEKVVWSYNERRKLKESNRLIFTKLNGDKLSVPVLLKIWQRAVIKAGYKDLQRTDVHALRHTFASWIAQSGKVDIYTLKDYLGHTSVKTTEIYAHLIPTPNNHILNEIFK